MLLVLVGLLTGSASAAEPTGAQARMYGFGRASVAIPAGYSGIAQSYSAEVGGMFKDGNAFGLRFVVSPDPPAVMGASTPNVALGPVLSWAYYLRLTPQFDLYPTAAVGTLFGVAPDTGKNKLLLYLQAGVGLRWRANDEDRATLTIAPEVGFVPAILAPYLGLNVGMLGPRQAAGAAAAPPAPPPALEEAPSPAPVPTAPAEPAPQGG